MTLRYVGIRVTDLDRSVAFYRQGLDLVETGRGSMNHGGGRFVQLEDPESRQALELNGIPPTTPMLRRSSPVRAWTTSESRSRTSGPCGIGFCDSAPTSRSLRGSRWAPSGRT